MFLRLALASAAVRQAGATSMKMDYLRLTNVRTDPITHPGGLSTHVHSFYGASEAAPSTTRAAASNLPQCAAPLTFAPRRDGLA